LPGYPWGMPRMPRIAPGDVIFHVLNRANAQATIFGTDERVGAAGSRPDGRGPAADDHRTGDDRPRFAGAVAAAFAAT
jgi:hypothetical protein